MKITTMAPLLSVVAPCFNEAANLRELVQRISAVVAPLGNYEIVLVDDGSRDDSVAVMRDLAAQNPCVRWLALSRNFGHQRALRAGLDSARGDAVISLDADLQHPPELIPTLVEAWRGGAEVVTTVRQDPPESDPFKRWTGRLFYRLLNAMSDTPIEPGSADFRLLDRRVVDAIRALPETDLFFRGLVPWLGFRVASVKFNPDARTRGQSAYTLRRMVSLAASGITSSSITPLRLSILLAVGLACVALLFVVYALLRWAAGDAVPGWTSILVVVALLGAMQLFVLGVIGEYLGRVLRQTQGRPPYLVRTASDEEAR
ncbi:glycosyltransferase family 2 protein [Roseiterribacter gracilis]|uniref:Glycosyl transferase family 2 n=1 Tax=Roseiterribacter gracilis TaxID=2812848 RepID=A0A8S8XFE6_9PROT|nr:glycosyl transferase family 2 [Rhodospirillales bacterium TMPK1]